MPSGWAWHQHTYWVEEVRGGRSLLDGEGGPDGFQFGSPPVLVVQSPPSLLTPQSLGIHLVKLSSLHRTPSPACPSWVFYIPLPFPWLGPFILQSKNFFWNYFEWGWSCTAHVCRMHWFFWVDFLLLCHHWELVVGPGVSPNAEDSLFPSLWDSPWHEPQWGRNSFRDESKDSGYWGYTCHLFPLK